MLYTSLAVWKIFDEIEWAAPKMSITPRLLQRRTALSAARRMEVSIEIKYKQERLQSWD